MNIPTIFNIAIIVVSIFLMAAILTQQRGTGLGGAFGGAGNVYRSKRGVEKAIFNASIVLAVLFVGVAVANLLLR